MRVITKERIAMCILTIILVFILSLRTSYFCLSDSKISTWNNADYPEFVIKISDIASYNNCKITGNTLEMIGDDPYIVFDLGGLLVRDVNLDILEGYDKSYKIYYAIDDIFSEEYVGRNWIEIRDDIILVENTVNLLRIDFEGTAIGEKYELKSDSIRLNSNQDEHLYAEYRIKPSIPYAIAFIVITGLYLIWGLFEKRYARTMIVYIYLLLMEEVVLNVAISNEDFLTKATMVGVCIGGGALCHILVQIDSQEKN